MTRTWAWAWVLALAAGCTSPRSLPQEATPIDAGADVRAVGQPDQPNADTSSLADVGAQDAGPADLAPADLAPDLSPDVPADATEPAEGGRDVAPDSSPDLPADAPPDLPPAPPDAAPPQPDSPPSNHGCAGDQIFCNETNRCHVPVICLVEYQGGSLDLEYQRLKSFCPAAPGGSARPEPNGLLRPGLWEAAANDGTCDALAARAVPLLCAGGTPHTLGARRLVYDPTSGALVSAVPLLGPRCPL